MVKANHTNSCLHVVSVYSLRTTSILYHLAQLCGLGDIISSTEIVFALKVVKGMDIFSFKFISSECVYHIKHYCGNTVG